MFENIKYIVPGTAVYYMSNNKIYLGYVIAVSIVDNMFRYNRDSWWKNEKEINNPFGTEGVTYSVARARYRYPGVLDDVEPMSKSERILLKAEDIFLSKDALLNHLKDRNYAAE
jgi:hypothetical protein